MERSTAVGMLVATLLLISAASAVAQSAPPGRIVQANDGTLYLLKDGVRYAIVGEPIEDDELAVYADGGSTGARLLLGATDPSQVVQRPVADAPEAVVESPPGEAAAPPQAAEPAAQPAACANTPRGAKQSASCQSQSPSSPPPAATAARFVSVTGSNPGGMASVSVAATPGDTCTLAFAQAVTARISGSPVGEQTVGPSGTVTWSFVIDANARPGTGSVTVTCGQQTITSPIQVGGARR